MNGQIPTELSGLNSIELFRIEGNIGIVGSMPVAVCDTFVRVTTISYSDCGLDSFVCDCCSYCCADYICECNVSDADICGDDLTEDARVPVML